jgi:hypothetical protein
MTAVSITRRGPLHDPGGGVVDSASDEIVKEFTSAHSGGVAHLTAKPDRTSPQPLPSEGGHR